MPVTYEHPVVDQQLRRERERESGTERDRERQGGREREKERREGERERERAGDIKERNRKDPEGIQGRL